MKKTLVLIFAALIIIFLTICIINNYYLELAIGFLVGLFFGFSAYFHWTETEINKKELIQRICSYIFFGLEISLFVFLLTGYIFQCQLGNLVAVPGIGLGILFGLMYKKSAKKVSG